LGNLILNNSVGILLDVSSNNSVCHNNFVNNTCQVYTYESVNVWDNGYPSGGNYWSDYKGVDLCSGHHQNETESDGISDTRYTIDANNVDRFPLAAPITTFDAGAWNGVPYNVDVVSNSTVSDFYFYPDEGPFLRFNVSSQNGTAGFCRVSIPKDLLWVEDGWIVYVGVQSLNYTIIPDENYTYIYFTYNHSIKTVKIHGTHAIPEFQSYLVLPLFIITTLIAAIIYRRKRFSISVPKREKRQSQATPFVL